MGVDKNYSMEVDVESDSHVLWIDNWKKLKKIGEKTVDAELKKISTYLIKHMNKNKLNQPWCWTGTRLEQNADLGPYISFGTTKNGRVDLQCRLNVFELEIPNLWNLRARAIRTINKWVGLGLDLSEK